MDAPSFPAGAYASLFRSLGSFPFITGEQMKLTR